jgi:thiamine-phosphate pyrophosphorylase
LHLVAADEVLDRPDFAELAAALLELGRRNLALHLRAHGRPGGALWTLAGRVAPAARAAGTLLVLNDRVDIALALAAAPAAGAPAAPAGARGRALAHWLPGVQLGARSLPVAAVRRVLPQGMPVGVSVHDVAEAAGAAGAGADWLLLGTIYATPSHPGRPGAGPALVRTVAAVTALPLIAIGGLTPERVGPVVGAGAHGVAVLRGVWSAPDPRAAIMHYLEALQHVTESKD